MSQTIRRTVALTALTAALLFGIPAPSHAAHLRGATLDGPALAADLVTRALSWLDGVFGVSTPAATQRRSTGLQKVTPPPPPPPMPPVTLPPTGVGGSGSGLDPDGR
jgi:hypothetical protein